MRSAIPTVSRDGTWSRTRRRTVEGNAYRTRIWCVDRRGGRPRAVTDGPVDDSAPAFAADGRHVLFLREHQVHRVALSGGVAEKLTSLAHGVDAFALSPDGRRLLLTGSAPEAALRGRAARSTASRRSPASCGASTGDSTAAASLDRHAHLCVAPARADRREARRIVSGDLSVAGAIWSPDGDPRRVRERSRSRRRPARAHAHLHRRRRRQRLRRARSPRWRGACRTPGMVARRPSHRLPRRRRGGRAVRARPSRSTSSRPTGGAPRDLAPGRHLYLGAERRLGPDRLAARGWQRARLGRPRRPCSAPSPSAAARSLWRFPLAGEPSEQAGTDGAACPARRLRVGRAGAAGRRARGCGRARGRRGRAAPSAHASTARPGPVPLAGPPHRAGRRSRARQARSAPGCSRRPAPRGRCRRCSRSSAGPGAQLGPARVAARPRARRSRLSGAAAGSPRVGLVRPRLARGDHRARGAAPMPRISSQSATGPSRRASPIPSASPCTASATAAS